MATPPPFFEKHFTFEEATALLPQLRNLFREIHAEIDRLERTQKDWSEALARAAANGGDQMLRPFFKTSEEIKSRLTRIEEMGIQVKDVRRGLVDFPTFIGDEEAFFCWLIEEPEIAYWHDLVSGFEGRLPL